MAVQCFSFGPFVLIPDRQILLRGETPVRLGNRAFEILAILVQRAGELISKQELISLVWPDTFVDESNLKVNIAAIRKALDAGGSHQSCIATIIGRGYRFIEPVQASETDSWASPENLTCFSDRSGASAGLIRRENVVQELTKQLEEYRLVTIVGSAGIGKRVVAIAVAEAVAQRHESGVSFVDLDLLDDPGLVNSCENVVGAAAAFVEKIQSHSPHVDALATTQ